MIRKRFTTDKIDFIGIPIERKIIGVLFGIFSAILIYSFLNVFREISRIFENEFSYPNGALILTKKERFLYNFLCAGMSVILGNSVAVLYFFSRPQKVIRRYATKHKRILNDNIFVNFNFIYWATKILYIVIAIFPLLDLSFVGDYYWVLIILLLVLYFEGWKALSQMQFRNKTLIRISHFLLLFGFAFGLAQLNAIDYHKIDKRLLEQNPFIDLPIAEFKDNRKSFYHGVEFLKLFIDNGEPYVSVDRSKRIKLTNFHMFLREDKRRNFNSNFKGFAAYVMASRDLPMHIISEFEQILLLNGFSQVRYLTRTPDEKRKNRFSADGGIAMKIPFSVNNYNTSSLKLPAPPIFPPMDLLQNKHIISLNISDSFLIGGITVCTVNELKEALKHEIHKDGIVQYNVAPNLVFQKYVSAISAHRHAVEELRNSERNPFLKCNTDYSNKYKKCKDQEKFLKEKYPFRCVRKITK